MVFMVVGALLVLSGASAMSLHQSCSTDRDCTQPDTYCYSSGKCVNCTDCGLYNRYSGTACAKDKNQCGKCLPGMDTEQNLDGTYSCHPSGTLTPSTQAPGSGPEATSDNFTVIIIVAILLILLVLCIASWFWCRKADTCLIVRNIFSICPNNSLMNSGECSKCPENSFQVQSQPVSRPPPYSENASAPPFEDPPDTTLCRQVYRAIENDPSQCANAYCNPQYVSGGSFEPNPEPEQEDVADENDALINTSSISQPPVDEETQPSNWTPTPDSETGSTTGPTNFAGSLSLQQLRISQPDVTVSVQPGSTNRSNSHPSIQFGTQSQQGNTENNSDGNTQQINIIAHVGPVYITK